MIKERKNLGQKLKRVGAIGLLALAAGGAGFGLGKASSNIDSVSFYRQGDATSDFKAIQVNRAFASDPIFIQRNSYNSLDSEDCEGDYRPMMQDLNRRYVESVVPQFAEGIVSSIDYQKGN